MPSHLGDVARPFYEVAKAMKRDMIDCDISKALKSLRLAQRQAIAAKEEARPYRHPWFEDKEPEELESESEEPSDDGE